jgi:hypothetical protein
MLSGGKVGSAKTNGQDQCRFGVLHHGCVPLWLGFRGAKVGSGTSSNADDTSDAWQSQRLD